MGDMENQIINALKQAGGRLTRNGLWEVLPGFDDETWDTYWTTEQALVDARRIERRRGRNGGIFLIEPAPEPATPSAAYDQTGPVDPERKYEAAYYDDVLASILAHWTEQLGFTNIFGAITAGQGSRPTGGRWSRPDLVICTVSDWLFSSRPEGDVRTIEIKRYEALDVLAVYEALSHKSRAHYAYLLVVNFPVQLDNQQQAEFDTVLEVAGRHGIGVITAPNAADWGTWTFELDPLRGDADNQAVHQLLLDQVPKDVRDLFRTSIRTITITI